MDLRHQNQDWVSTMGMKIFPGGFKQRGAKDADHHKRRRLRFEEEARDAHRERYTAREEFGQRAKPPKKRFWTK